MRALWSARVDQLAEALHHLRSSSAEQRPRARPRARSAARRRDRLAPAGRAPARAAPSRDVGFGGAKKARTVAASRLSCQSSPSARRRSMLTLGQLGLVEMKALSRSKPAPLLVAAQDRPFDQLLRERIADRLLHRVRLGDLAAADEIDRLLDQRDVRGGVDALSATCSGWLGSAATRAGGAAGVSTGDCIASSRIEGSASSRIDGLSVAAAAGVTGEKLIVGRIAVGESVGFTGWAVTDATVNCGRGARDRRLRCRLGGGGLRRRFWRPSCLAGLALAFAALALSPWPWLAWAWRLAFGGLGAWPLGACFAWPSGQAFSLRLSAGFSAGLAANAGRSGDPEGHRRPQPNNPRASAETGCASNSSLRPLRPSRAAPENRSDRPWPEMASPTPCFPPNPVYELLTRPK